MFHLATGLYCPGCGGTRALAALLRGQFLTSFQYHPLVPYLAVILPALLVSLLYCRRRRKPLPVWAWKGAAYMGIVVLAVNFAVKNYFLIFKGMDLL